MKASRGMGAINPKKVPRAKRRGDSKPVIGTGKAIKTFSGGGQNAGSHAGSAPNPGQKAGSGGSSGLNFNYNKPNPFGTFNVGRNQTVSVGGGLRNPKLTYNLKFKNGGKAKSKR